MSTIWGIDSCENTEESEPKYDFIEDVHDVVCIVSEDVYTRIDSQEQYLLARTIKGKVGLVKMQDWLLYSEALNRMLVYSEPYNRLPI